MIGQKICVFLFDGFSDWEIAYLGPEIRQNQKAEIIYFSEDGYSVSSAGGLTVTPDSSVQEIAVADFSMLVLPGGEPWEEGRITMLDALVREFSVDGKFLAAICSATTFLAERGYLNTVKHTSNALPYLKQFAPRYQGEELYDAGHFAVHDRNIITANGTAPVEFASKIFEALGLQTEEENQKWVQLFKYGIWTE